MIKNIKKKNKKDGFGITIASAPPALAWEAPKVESPLRLIKINQEENKKCSSNSICGHDLVCSQGLYKKKPMS